MNRRLIPQKKRSWMEYIIMRRNIKLLSIKAMYMKIDILLPISQKARTLMMKIHLQEEA